MKHLTLKLIRKLLKKVEKCLDVPVLKIKECNHIAQVHEYSIYITDKVSHMTVHMSRDEYFKIRDQIKSYSKKYEKTKDRENGGETPSGA